MMGTFLKPKLWGITFIFLLMLAVIASGCAPKTPQDEVTLRFTVLPIIDSLPMYVAQQEGFFDKYNVEVELIPVGSGPERDQLIAAGQADGMINEVLTTIFNNRTESNVMVVRFARAATKDTPLFSIIASKDSGITTLDGLKGVEIGISEGTVIEYLTDRLLQLEGFSEDEIATIAVPKIPDRLALLSSGDLAAGMMPEPLTTLLVSQGARVVIDDTSHPEISHSTIAFRKATLDEYPDAVKAFLKAIEEAVVAINADPGKYEQVLVDNNILPQPLVGKFAVPTFVTASVPDENQYQDVLQWAIDKGLLETEVPYERCVTTEFLP